MSFQVTKSEWFSWVFGVISPILAVIFDPLIFQGDTGGYPIFFNWTPGSYAAIAGGVLLLTFWLISKKSNPMIGGALAAFATLAFILGICMLPISLIGIMFFGIGLLGLLPFCAAYTYARSASQCCKQGGNGSVLWLKAAGFGMVIIVVSSVQISAARYMEATLTHIKRGDVIDYPSPLMEVMGFRYRLLFAWLHSTEIEQEKIAAAYQTLTGRSISQDAMIID